MFLWISPIVCLAATFVAVAVLGALGAECRGDFMDGPRTCNDAGSAREAIGWGGFLLSSAGFVGLAIAVVASDVRRSLRGDP